MPLKNFYSDSIIAEFGKVVGVSVVHCRPLELKDVSLFELISLS
tara:strand:- start:1663 stop:1794 length:132 start_codon:yes stop_codon:yes gene_type:complete